MDETIPVLSIRAAMARAGLHSGQREVWYDDNVRHDPLEDRDSVLSLVLALDELIAAASGEDPTP